MEGLTKSDYKFFFTRGFQLVKSSNGKYYVIPAKRVGTHNQADILEAKIVAIECGFTFDSQGDVLGFIRPQKEQMDKIVEQVRQKLLERSQVGIRKYGSTIWDNTDENYMKHLQDELLDGANYCEQMIRLGEFAKLSAALIESEPNDQELGRAIRFYYNELKQ
jgi:hypothetical protein